MCIRDRNRLFYLQDYNFSKSRGDLMQWTGKDSTKIDEDVSEILR